MSRPRVVRVMEDAVLLLLGVNNNAITTQHAPNGHFLRTKWVMLMLMRLTQKPMFVFVRVTTKAESCISTEKKCSPRTRMVFDLLTGGLPNGLSLSLICIGLKQGSPNFFVQGPYKLLRNSLRAGHLT